MQRYKSPEMQITKFATNGSVSYCDSTNVYNSVTISCLVEGSHKVFYDGCETNYNDLYFVSYEGVTYLVWTEDSDASVNSGVSSGNIISASGYTGSSTSGANFVEWLCSYVYSSVSTGGEYHAGILTTDITSVVNQST